jgi:hypothetical protein
VSSELEAFLGPSFAVFDRDGSDFIESDSHVNPILDATGWKALRFRGHTRQSEQAIVSLWDTYRKLLDRRPSVDAYVPRSFEQLRASFDRALLARDEAAAQTDLQLLRERHSLSAENRHFLEIRMNAALGRWAFIAEHPLLPSLVNLQLPPETYGDILEGIYEAHVRPIEATGDLSQLLKVFEAKVAEDAAPLFRSRGTSRRASVVKAFLLYELLQPSPSDKVCWDLLKVLPLGAFGAVEQVIKNRVEEMSGAPSAGAGLEAFRAGQYDRAYQMLLEEVGSPDVLMALLRSVRESGDSAKAIAALESLGGAPEKIAEVVRAGVPTTVREVQELSSLDIGRLDSWADRIRWQVEAGETEAGYVLRWREMARSADPAEILQERDLGRAASESLVELIVEYPRLFDQVHPLWYELFIVRCPPESNFAPLYLALIETLRVRNTFGGTELALAKETLSALVNAGVDADTYRKGIEEICAVFQIVRAPSTLQWAIEVTDILALAPCRDASSRLRYQSSVLQAARDYQARLSPVQRSMLRLLTEEAGIPFEIQESPNQVNEVSGGEAIHCKVVIYSLDEDASRRAKQALLTIHPTLIVDTSNVSANRTPP